MLDFTNTYDTLIETKGLKTAAILAALYNAASRTGLGESDEAAATMTEVEAEAILAENRHDSFDYLGGKRLKINLDEAEYAGFLAGQYDYGQGKGTAAAAIAILRDSGDPCDQRIIALQQKSKAASARIAAPLPNSGSSSQGNLADALGLTPDHPVEGFKGAYAGLAKEPCTTFTL